MALERFRSIRLRRDNKLKLDIINSIIEEFRQDDLKMTLRQLYYQLVSRDIIPNKQSEYSKLSNLLKEGRMAGIVDWDAIEDRLRVPHIMYSNTSPEQAVQDAIHQYRLNRQEGQDTYLEVWVEKDALSGVLKRVTSKYHIRLLVNRGYGSVTAIHDAYHRILSEMRKGKRVKILYLGDHDPSGIDMIRDIETRIMEMLITADGWTMIANKFGENFYQNDDFQDWNVEAYENEKYFYDTEIRDFDEDSQEYVWDYTKAWIKDSFSVEAIALTMEQIKRYNPPKNPAKISDPRAKWYINKYGYSSWEVDALNPKTLNKLLGDKIEENINMNLFQNILDSEEKDKERLEELKNEML